MTPFPDPRRDIADELNAHIQARVDHLVRQGLTPDEARAEALRRFGDLDAAKSALLAQSAGERRRRTGREWLDALRQDLRYVRRSLIGQPAFTLGVVATLALGLGINSALFRVADRVLLRAPEGVRRPEALRTLESPALLPSAEAIPVSTYSYPDARTVTASTTWSQVTVNTPPRLVSSPDGHQISVAYVDGAYFPMLGVMAAQGRTFDAREGAAGAGIDVAVVSFGYWQRALASAPLSPAVTVAVGSKRFQVIGVAPAGFSGIDLDPADVWLPMGAADFGRGFINGVVIPWYQTEMMRGLRILARLMPGAGDAAAASELSGLLGAADTAQGRPARRITLRPLVPYGGAAVSDASRRLINRLAGVSAIVLLIACANAMHLLLARGIRRQREIATRLALGAGRLRIWRLLMVESLSLAVASGAAAALAGGWTATALRALIFPDSRWTTPWFDLRTLAFTGVLAIAAGLASGVAPALQAANPDLLSAIKLGRASFTRRTRVTRTALLVMQTALSIVLLVASGLLVRSLIRLNAVDLGFNPDGLVTMMLTPVSITADLHASRLPPDALAARVLQTESGVQVALTSVAPFGAVRINTTRVPGSSYEPPSDADNPRVSNVSPNYFAVLGTTITWGRAFAPQDADGEPVSIVSASMARNYWGATLPLGACVLPVGSPCARVVGIVQDIRESAGGAAAPMIYYLPLDQGRGAPNTLVLRTTASRAHDLAARLKSIVPSDTRATMEVTADRIGRALRPWSTATTLFASLGAMALLLACLGIYSIVSYGASERAHEMGVRVALGATSGDLLRLIVGNGIRLVLAGAMAGLAAAAAGGQLLSSLLFEVSPFDAGVYLAALAGITLAGLAAMLPAALRASRVDALAALRED